MPKSVQRPCVMEMAARASLCLSVHQGAEPPEGYTEVPPYFMRRIGVVPKFCEYDRKVWISNADIAADNVFFGCGTGKLIKHPGISRIDLGYLRMNYTDIGVTVNGDVCFSRKHGIPEACDNFICAGRHDLRNMAEIARWRKIPYGKEVAKLANLEENGIHPVTMATCADSTTGEYYRVVDYCIYTPKADKRTDKAFNLLRGLFASYRKPAAIEFTANDNGFLSIAKHGLNVTATNGHVALRLSNDGRKLQASAAWEMSAIRDIPLGREFIPARSDSTYKLAFNRDRKTLKYLPLPEDVSTMLGDHSGNKYISEAAIRRKQYHPYSWVQKQLPVDEYIKRFGYLSEVSLFKVHELIQAGHTPITLGDARTVRLLDNDLGFLCRAISGYPEFTERVLSLLLRRYPKFNNTVLVPPTCDDIYDVLAASDLRDGVRQCLKVSVNPKYLATAKRFMVETSLK